jgi:aspartate kinase
MLVMKFGGTSVEDAEAILRVAQIVRGRLKNRPVVVVSAMAGVTDALVRMAAAAKTGNLDEAIAELQAIRQRHFKAASHSVSPEALDRLTTDFGSIFHALSELLKGIAAVGELSPRSSDLVLSFGEVLSSLLVTAALNSNGIEASHVDARKVVVTDNSHKAAVPNQERTEQRLQEHVLPLVASGLVPVLAGFIGGTQDGDTTTLGRGGSDFSAAIVGAGLAVERIEIWTDVEGMLTTDPRICPDAGRISALGFEEAAELAFFGAKVLHPATLLPAMQRDIPVFILNSRNPKSRGTCIQAKAARCKTTFRAIAAKKNATVVSLRAPRMLQAFGFLRALFQILEKHRCPVDLVSTSEVSVSLVVDSANDLASIVPALKQLGEVEVEPAKAIVCLVGNDIKGKVGIAASVFSLLAEARVNAHMISQGASEINISVVIDEADVPRAVRHLHQHFFPATVSSPSQKLPSASVRRPTPAGSLSVGQD